MNHFRFTREFIRDFKKLAKKYRTLNKDLEGFKILVASNAIVQNKHFAILHKFKNILICKARFHCEYLRGYELRIIYAYHKETKEIEFIEFIELYFKGNKAREDKVRIGKYLKRYSI